jgi:hypothetical protein
MLHRWPLVCSSPPCSYTWRPPASSTCHHTRYLQLICPWIVAWSNGSLTMKMRTTSYKRLVATSRGSCHPVS